MSSLSGRLCLLILLSSVVAACSSEVAPYDPDQTSKSATRYPEGTADPLSLAGGGDERGGSPFDRALDCSIAIGLLGEKMDSMNVGASANEMAMLRRAGREYRRQADALAGPEEDVVMIAAQRREVAENDVANELKRAMQCLKAVGR